MDPLSIAAAVSGFLGLAGKIATTLKNYVDGVQSAPDEVQSLHLEVAALCQVLKDLMVFLQKDDLCGRKFESSSVLFKAIKACQYRLEELRGKLADLSEACLNKKLPGWIKRIKWPLKKDEVQQTMVALRSFAQIFQFSIVANNCELVSKTSSAMILQLDENRQGIEKLAAGLEAHSVSVPSKLKQQMSELSEIKTLVTELSQFNMEVVHNIPLGMSEIQERLQDNEFRQIMPLISPLEPHRRHQDIWQKRLEGTGNWFLLETEFQKWRDNESDDGSICSILACSGIPGAGKSVVCSIVFSHLETKFASEELVCVACLYCDYQEEKKQTPANMIGVLLNQVIATLNKARLLPSDIISTLKERLNEQKSLNLGEACRLLGKTVKHLRRFYVCIDALDECNERHRRDFIQSLAKVSSECRQPTVIRIFFTSRPHIKWKELMNRYSRLGPLDHICLKAQPEDIRIYISHEIDIDENGDCMNEKLRSEILDTIVANSDGMFLLAALQIQTVLDETTISTRRSTLYNMPTKLETAFESTIARIKNQKSQRSKQAMEVLKWTFLATRPLTVEELRHALSITIDPGKMQGGHLPLVYDKTLDWDNFPSEKSLMDWCLGLIIIDEETSTVRLVHKSLHDFLTQLYEDGEIFQDGHNEIAYTCLRYMLFNDDQHEIDTVQQKVSEDIKVLRRRTFCLLDYATNNFGHHLRDQGGCAAEMINAHFQNRININCISTGYRSAFLSPFNGWREQIHSGKNGYITTNRMHFRLQFAVSCGLENVFRSFLEASDQAIDFNTRLGGSTMLLQASRIGQDGIVRMLLERRIDVNQADCNGLTALSWASSMGHDSIVKQLIQADSIDINSHDRFLRTALSWACLKGHDSVVKLLLQADGVDINSRDDAGQKALSLASLHGHDSVVKLLLQADSIEINSKDRNGRSALSSASAMGHDEIVKLLLQADSIEINSQDRFLRTALSWACLKGHDSVVNLLLQADGVDINSKDNSGLKALSLASLHGYGSIVKLLLQAGSIEINSKDENGCTALCWASRNGHGSIVKLLLQADSVEINSKDKNGCTAFSWASQNGHDQVVKLLLQAGCININSEVHDGQTALLMASRGGHDRVVKLLLQADGIYINSKDKKGYTALSWASENGHESVVKVLLQANNIDIFSRNDFDETAFSLASKNGHESIVELFRDYKSDSGRMADLIRRRYRAEDELARRALKQLLTEFDFTHTRSQDADCSSAASMSSSVSFDSVLELPELHVTDSESEGHGSQLPSLMVLLHGSEL